MEEIRTFTSLYAVDSAILRCVDIYDILYDIYVYSRCILHNWGASIKAGVWTCAASRAVCCEHHTRGLVVLWPCCVATSGQQIVLSDICIPKHFLQNYLCCTESMLHIVQRRSILQIREYCNISILFQSMKVRKGLSNRGIRSRGNQY